MKLNDLLKTFHLESSYDNKLKWIEDRLKGR